MIMSSHTQTSGTLQTNLKLLKGWSVTVPHSPRWPELPAALSCSTGVLQQ